MKDFFCFRLCSYDELYADKNIKVAMGIQPPPLAVRDPSTGAIIDGAAVRMLNSAMAPLKPNITFIDLPFGTYANSPEVWFQT